jgi:hypothetical protein
MLGGVVLVVTRYSVLRIRVWCLVFSVQCLVLCVVLSSQCSVPSIQRSVSSIQYSVSTHKAERSVMVIGDRVIGTVLRTPLLGTWGGGGGERDEREAT